MNTASDRPRIPGVTLRPRLWIGAAAAAALVLAACIQGPWDYYPEDPPVFRGVTVTGYALSGKPIEHICFERLLNLDEENTQAYGFYNHADVRITGSFGGTLRTLSLTAIADTPNCFKGDSAALVERGHDYAMEASLDWDSAGTEVHTVVRGTAKVPAMFKVHDTAAAPRLAKTGGVPSNIFNGAFIRSLPPEVLFTLASDFPELADIFAPNIQDTTAKADSLTPAQQDYIKKNGKKITARLLELLQKQDPYRYAKGATLFYLNGDLNTLSHYYSCDRSPDVQSVLITQLFDPAGARPETAFDRPVGLMPDSFQYYFPGNHRRLLIYPDAKGSKGWNLLDSMGVVNVWFHTLRNRLYFYGMEQAYYAYLSRVTQVQGGGGGDADPRVIPKYNVTGGHGIFVGGIPDSFDVYIQTDKLTKIYPLPEVHGLACDENGWFSGPDCRDYYRNWCKGKDWKTGQCGVDAVMYSLEGDVLGDSAAKARFPGYRDTLSDLRVLQAGTEEFCADNDFPAGAACAQARTDCLESKGVNSCKQALWDYCRDHSWRPAQCGAGLASYCRDQPRLSEVLCRHADLWCTDPANAGSPLCK
jgi:hypothetical protein